MVFGTTVACKGYIFMMQEGYVKISREILKWEWYNDSKMVHVFLHLIVNANYKQKEWRGQTIQRGQLVTGIKSLSSATNVSTMSIRTCLRRLKLAGEITIKPTNKYSLVTIVKYDIYQSSEPVINSQNNKPANNPSTNKQQSNNKQSTTTNKENKEKNEKKDNNINKEELVFPFQGEDFLRAWGVLCDQKKWRKKEVPALQASLKKLSRFTEEVAIKIIEDAIAGEWQGIHTDKYEKGNAVTNTAQDIFTESKRAANNN